MDPSDEAAAHRTLLPAIKRTRRARETSIAGSCYAMEPFARLPHALAEFSDPLSKSKALVGIRGILKLQMEIIKLPPLGRTIQVVGVEGRPMV
jgi:hypothetical protein